MTTLHRAINIAVIVHPLRSPELTALGLDHTLVTSSLGTLVVVVLALLAIVSL